MLVRWCELSPNATSFRFFRNELQLLFAMSMYMYTHYPRFYSPMLLPATNEGIDVQTLDYIIFNDETEKTKIIFCVYIVSTILPPRAHFIYFFHSFIQTNEDTPPLGSYSFTVGTFKKSAKNTSCTGCIVAAYLWLKTLFASLEMKHHQP